MSVHPAVKLLRDKGAKRGDLARITVKNEPGPVLVEAITLRDILKVYGPEATASKIRYSLGSHGDPVCLVLRAERQEAELRAQRADSRTRVIDVTI